MAPFAIQERVNLVNDIKSIINDYPSDSSLFKEFLQNSDDAGATRQVFTLDHRTHRTDKLVDTSLSATQGPALFCENDSVFDESNWKAITTTHSSDKTTDFSKTGKYGVGFRSCYHITDNPHILSKDTLVILDPHYGFHNDEIKGGARITLSTDGRSYADQLAAFAPVLPLPADLYSSSETSLSPVQQFPGTIIRLPLRTEAQGRTTQIKPGASVTPARIKTLVEEFVLHESATCLLFLKNIASIEFWEIDEHGSRQFLARTEVTNIKDIVRRRSLASRPCLNGETSTVSFPCQIATSTLGGGGMVKQSWILCHTALPPAQTAVVMSRRLAADVAKYGRVEGEEMEKLLANEKFAGHVALAFALDDDNASSSGRQGTADQHRGRLFTLLPLPIYTDFPLHLNGVFALMSNRQGLDTIDGKHTSLHPREWLRVQWNFAIFEDFLPGLWASLLNKFEELHISLSDPYRSFPRPSTSSGNNCYWTELPKLVLDKAVERNYPIFPLVGYHSNGHLEEGKTMRLQDVLVSTSSAMKILAVLGKMGVPVVRPPKPVLQVLEQLSSKWRKECPSDVALVMKDNKAGVNVTKLDAAEKNLLLGYLLESNNAATLTRVVGFPLFPTVDGQYISLPPPSNKYVKGQPYVIVTEEEEHLFAGLPCSTTMIQLFQLSPTAIAALQHADARQYADVSGLTAQIVLDLLRAKLASSTLVPDGDDVRCDQLLHWLLRFWEWAAGWSELKQLLSIVEIKTLYLIPTSANTLRRVADAVLNITTFDAPTITAFEALGVPFSHREIPADALPVLAQLGFVRRANATKFVLDHIQPDRVENFTEGARMALHLYFQMYLKANQLKPSQRATLHRLPLYPILSPCEDGTAPASSWGSMQGRLILVRLPSGHPLPIQSRETTTFVDMSKHKAYDFVQLVVPPAEFRCLTELDLLQELCIPKLGSQPLLLLDALFSRIVHRMTELFPESLARLRKIRCIPVSGSERKCPSEVFDPDSRLAELYREEDGRFPVKPYSDGKMLATLRSHQMIVSQLESWIVEERIGYVAGRAGGRSEPPEDRYAKAKALLRILDKDWGTTATKFIACAQSVSSIAWLPCDRREQRELCPADQCRDSEKDDSFLFDLRLMELDGRVKSASLRKALGWDKPLALSVVLSQLERTFESFYPPPEGGPKFSNELKARLQQVMQHLRRMFLDGRVSEEEVQEIRRVVGDRAWFEVGGTLVPTRYLFLSQDFRFEDALRVTVVPSHLAPNWGGFLMAMGVEESPPVGLLIEEVNEVANRLPNRNRVMLAVNVLEAIASQCSSNLDDHLHPQAFTLLVPDKNNRFVPRDQVMYNDIGDRSASIPGDEKLILHAKVSGEVAAKLGIMFASSAELGADDEDSDDELEMAQDLSATIRSVLQKYDVSTAFNEFLANAIDAKATKFSIVLDERSHGQPSDKLLTHAMKDTQDEALVFHNNAVFTDADFKGICKIGEGGKVETPNTIGRFGLGSLSMFHFTDIALVVSGRHMLFLNPSSTRLPRRVNGGKPRTVLKRTIAYMQREYPSMVKPFYGMYNFSAASSECRGTIFRLPLTPGRKTVVECSNLISRDYLHLAKSAFFFNALSEVTAFHHGRFSSGLQQMWQVTSEVVQSSYKAPKSESDLRAHYLHLHVEHDKAPLISASREDANQPVAQSAEKWLVVQSHTPMSAAKEHNDVLIDYRYHTNTQLTTHLALCLSAPKGTIDHHFFARLMLPYKTALPFHLDAPFALSDDRRNIRFETTKSGEHPPASAYNAWLLTDIIPRLHHFALSHITTAEKADVARRSEDWWPLNFMGEPDHEMARAFYRYLAETPFAVCRTIMEQPILPKDAIFPVFFSSEVAFPFISGLFRKLQVPNFVDLAPNACKIIRELKVEIPDITPALVKQTVVEREAAFVNLFNEKKISVNEIEYILEFLLGAADPKASPSTTLLLLTADGLRRFDPEGPVVYDTYNLYESPRMRVFADTFPQSRFLSTKLLRGTVKLLLASDGLKVKELTMDGLVSLIEDIVPAQDRCEHPPDKQRWITALLNSDDLDPSFYPNLMKSTRFGKLPLFALQNEGQFVSLEYAREHCLQTGSLPSDLGSVMQKMGLVVLKAETKLERHFVLLSSASQLPKLSLETFVKHSLAMESLPWQTLSESEYKTLAEWIKLQLHANLPSLNPTLRPTLFSMPIWEARERGNANEVWTALDDSVYVLDTPVLDLETLLEFTRNTVYVIPHDRLFLRFRDYDIQIITPANISSVLEIPGRLPDNQDDIARFRRLLEGLLSFVRGDEDGRDMVRVPNRQREMKHPRELYDSTIDVFRLSLERTQSAKLVHPAFADMQPRLRQFGLPYNVNVSTLVVCATTLSRELNGQQAPGQAVDQARLAAANSLFGQYTAVLPSQIQTTGAAQWRQFDLLSFIPRRNNRRHGILYDTSAYCTSLPTIISPSSALLSSFESICWTQRACLSEDPPVLLQATDWRFGSPSASEVVAHLRVLATEAMKDHPGSDMLLHDLNATYKWLNEHHTEAHEDLVLLTEELLFLNVDDPAEEQWQWNSADQLVLGLRRDTGTLSAVRAHLLAHKDLLLAGGVQTLADPKYNRKQSSPSSGSTVQQMFNEMRQKGELIDLELVPSRDPEGASLKPLRCHRAFMAASIPYFRDVFTSGMAESSQRECPVEGTRFIASAYIEYVYTGTVEITEPENGEQATELLENLLELLEHTNVLQVEDLKELVGWCIHEQSLLTPDTLEAVKDAAVKSNCESLKKYCDDYEGGNTSTLRALSREEASQSVS